MGMDKYGRGNRKRRQKHNDSNGCRDSLGVLLKHLNYWQKMPEDGKPGSFIIQIMQGVNSLYNSGAVESKRCFVNEWTRNNLIKSEIFRIDDAELASYLSRIGTVAAAFKMGKGIVLMGKLLDKKFAFVSVLSPERP